MLNKLITDKTRLQRRLLLAFLAVAALVLLPIKVLVNPSSTVSNFLESITTNENAMLVYTPSMAIEESIARFAPGKPKWLILSVIGRPRFVERNLRYPGCSKVLSSSDEVWFYEVASHLLIAVGFVGDKCSVARIFGGEDVYLYGKWKLNQVAARAVGQSASEIEAWLGHCFEKDSDSRGWFYLSSGSVFMLEMENGRCIRVSPMAIFH